MGCMETSKIPHWDLLLTLHLPLSGKLGHKGQNLQQTQLLTWQMPAGPSSVKAGQRLILENVSDLRGDVFSAPNQL